MPCLRQMITAQLFLPGRRPLSTAGSESLPAVLNRDAAISEQRGRKLSCSSSPEEPGHPQLQQANQWFARESHETVPTACMRARITIANHTSAPGFTDIVRICYGSPLPSAGKNEACLKLTRGYNRQKPHEPLKPDCSIGSSCVLSANVQISESEARLSTHPSVPTRKRCWTQVPCPKHDAGLRGSACAA